MSAKLTHIRNLRRVLAKGQSRPFYTPEQKELLNDIENPIVNHPSLVSYTPPHHSFSLENREKLDELEEIRGDINAIFATHDHNVSLKTKTVSADS